MRLLLDEMLSPAIARELQARGHDVESVAGDLTLQGLPDAEILVQARSARRVLVTNNVRDFRPLAAEAVAPGGDGHAGMVFLFGAYRRTKADRGRMVAALEAVLKAHPDDDALDSGELWL